MNRSVRPPSRPDFETIELAQAGRVAHIVLNRPEKRNAMNATMLAELDTALRWAATDSDVRVSVLRGNGVSFSSGFDVQPSGNDAEYGGGDVIEDYLDLRIRLDQLFAVWQHPKPVIVAVHGHCLGAATILAALADLTLVAEDARVGIPSLPLGGGFLTPTWVHLIGPKRAKQIAFQVGAAMSAVEAVDWGFANEVVPGAELVARADELAESIARTPTSLLVLKKAAINRMVELSGFSVGAQLGPLTDTLTHRATDVSAFREYLQEHGVRQTLEAFQSGY